MKHNPIGLDKETIVLGGRKAKKACALVDPECGSTAHLRWRKSRDDMLLLLCSIHIHHMQGMSCVSIGGMCRMEMSSAVLANVTTVDLSPANHPSMIKDV